MKLYAPVILMAVIGIVLTICAIIGLHDIVTLLAGVEIGIAVAVTIWYDPK